MRRIIVTVIAMMLVGCHGEQKAGAPAKSAEEQRIEKEVVKRVGIAATAAKARQATLHTVRLAGFVVLAGGAVAGLLWLRHPRSPIRDGGTQVNRPLHWSDHHPPGTGRVIDLASFARPPSHPHPHPNRTANHETTRRS